MQEPTRLRRGEDTHVMLVDIKGNAATSMVDVDVALARALPTMPAGANVVVRVWLMGESPAAAQLRLIHLVPERVNRHVLVWFKGGAGAGPLHGFRVANGGVQRKMDISMSRAQGAVADCGWESARDHAVPMCWEGPWVVLGGGAVPKGSFVEASSVCELDFMFTPHQDELQARHLAWGASTFYSQATGGMERVGKKRGAARMAALGLRGCANSVSYAGCGLMQCMCAMMQMG